MEGTTDTGGDLGRFHGDPEEHSIEGEEGLAALEDWEPRLLSVSGDEDNAELFTDAMPSLQPVAVLQTVVLLLDATMEE